MTNRKRPISIQDYLLPEHKEIFNPNLGVNFKKFNSMHDMKDGGEKLFKAITYAFRNMDKLKYSKFRSGQLSLA